MGGKLRSAAAAVTVPRAAVLAVAWAVAWARAWAATWTVARTAASATTRAIAKELDATAEASADATATRRIYQFSLGNSLSGAVGYRAQVVAASESEAVARLQRATAGAWQGIDLDGLLVADAPDGPREYLRFYLNAGVISAADIENQFPEGYYD